MSEIDWTVFDRYPEDTCRCLCGETFRSHAKGMLGPPTGPTCLVSRRPCPRCGSTYILRASSDPEVVTIGGSDE